MCSTSTQLNPMKKLKMDGDEPHFPEDIIRNILKRLPVKSLIRFQCVCKHWKNLIKIPSFIAEHLHFSARQNPFLLYQGHDQFHPSGWCFFNHEMQVFKSQSIPILGSFFDVCIVGSINGLLCFQSEDESIFLWNPATREVRQVYQSYNISECREFYIGFGFSSLANDYKIVRIHVDMMDRLIRSEECSLCTSQVHEVQVYSLSTGSWKEIEFGNLDGVSLMSSGKQCNGAIVWFGFMLSVGEQDENDGHLVVSYDIETEVFTLIPLPSSAPKSYRNRLTMHENKLAMLCHTSIGNLEFSSVDLWVMEEGTGASSERWNWSKKYSIGPLPFLLEPGTITGNEIFPNFLLLGATKCEVNIGATKCEVNIFATKSEVSRRERKVVLFNIITNELKMFPVLTYGDGTGSFFNYVESLVSVNNNPIKGFET